MKKQLRLVAAPLAALILVFLTAADAPAQDTSETAEGCGTEVTSQEAALYLELLAQGVLDRVTADAQAPPYCMPIMGHIVRRSDGTGGLSITRYQQSIADCNFYFAGTGIQFYSLGIDYIDSDFYYSNITSGADINALRNENVVAEAINVYYTESLPGLCGISSFTFSSVQGIVMNNSCTATGSNHSTMPHEVGHYVDLFHTHETAFGVEYANGSNCLTAGDLLCDTPADPNLSGLVGPFPGCNYTGTLQDPLGANYNPDTHQIMSYSRPQCADKFSPLSKLKTVETLLNLRMDHLSRGCTPFPAPVLTAVDPPQSYIDKTLDVLLVGANFGDYTTVFFGEGIEVTTFTLLAPESLLINIAIDIDAELGPRDVVVVNAFDPDTLPGGFEVLPTRRHYVSPTGAAVYPYVTPAEAANTFTAAFGAASPGDSVLVDSTTVSGTFFTVTKSISVLGGWADAFTTRPGRTRLVLSGNVTLAPGTGGAATLDGFVLDGGVGSVEPTPINGRYGGGVRISGGSATVRNCEIRDCVANPGAGFGGGGGIYATNSVVTIADNLIHLNDATYGGGIYLYNASGSVTGNIIESNPVTASGGPVYQPQGGGIAIESCTALILGDNTIRFHTGAQNGGGIWVQGSSGVVIDGGEVSYNACAQHGGGVYAGSSTVTVQGASLSRNAAGFGGGGLAVEGASSSVTASDCEVLWNTALLAAGLYGSQSTVFARHNLFVGNTASATGGGIYLGTAPGGEIAGNTLDRNGAGSGVGGILLSGAVVDASNNIVVNTTGVGVSCSGGAPVLSYNLVYGSSGADYSGCGAGTGSVSGDPLFADTSATDYRLALHSPAIDAGDPDAGRNDPDGSRGDMGRYGSHAFAMAQPSFPQGLVATPSGPDLVLSWNRNPEGDVAYYTVYCDSTGGFRPSADNLWATTADTTLIFGAPADTTYYVVCAVDTSGYASGFSTEVVSLPGSTTGAGDVVRYDDALMQNVPNPFNPTTAIRFSLAAPAHVRLAVYDVSGRRVRTLLDAPRGSGPHTAVWDGTNTSGRHVASGVYFYRLEAGRFSETRKMMLLK
ncbi:MAG: T9SS type A sorting domain-containing protein [Candidatus Krumholzibacteria bacterium]|nr:T9SS type A sorting domain-containing protein [Candidatus Krumholzibacteria bacterium]